MTYNPNAAASGITRIGTYVPGVGAGGSEVVAYEDGLLYVTNGTLGRIDVIDAATMTLRASIDLTGVAFFKGVTSVAVKGGVLAAAIDCMDLDNAGTPGPRDGVLALFDAADTMATPIVVQTGNHPDMVTFSADGSMVFVANEGEKDATYAAQPRGGITVIDLAGPPTATTHDFGAFDGQEDALRTAGVRIFPGQTTSLDLEPEYIASSPDGTTIFVTLQEANAVAVFDLGSMRFTGIQTLGVTDHAQTGFELDASDRDDTINIHNLPVFGMRMADAIASFELCGATFYATANEGDNRGEDARAGTITLDPTAFPDADALQDPAALGRLGISTIDGDVDGDGDYDQLLAYGSRSFSIYSADGTLLFDSGSLFERTIANLRVPNAFNNQNHVPGSGVDDTVSDTRSDEKGPEPEALAVGEVDGTLYAFVGLEADGGIMVLRINDPTSPELAAYIESAVVGDTGPETIRFIDAADSLTGHSQIAVACEISGTTTLIDLANTVCGRVTSRDGDLSGSLGSDRLVGRAGANELWGGGSADVLRGRAGADVLVGGFGNDRMLGGAGGDRFVFGRGDGRDRIGDFQDGDTLDLSSTGAAFGDLTISETSAVRTEVTLGDDLTLVLRHDASVSVDQGDFLLF